MAGIPEVQLQARRVFRLSLTTALSLAIAYGLALPLPFLTPLMALMLTAKPGPPLGLKQLLGLVLVLFLTLSMGLLMIPMLLEYPFSAFGCVALGIYFSFYLTLHKGKVLFGLLLTLGFTMISAAGTVNFTLAVLVIQALVLAVALAVGCHWLASLLFPEDGPAAGKAPDAVPTSEQSNWLALRATLIVLPVYFVALTNPQAYLALIMKSVTLSQQSSALDARNAARELLGSTFLAGVLAIVFWWLLELAPNLWFFFWLMLTFGIYIAVKLYRVVETRYSASFWQNAAVTMLILLGPAVQDSANGNDIYSAFAVRMGLFIAVTVYAVFAVHLLEYLRKRGRKPASVTPLNQEVPG